MHPTISAARIAANQANAARSTGPRTVAGKVASRANALKHGLTAQVVGLDGIDESPDLIFDPITGANVAWLTAQMFRTMAQLDRVARIEIQARTEAAFRAETVWKDDQFAAAETLGLKLSRQPAWVVSQLSRTPAGCCWLIARWELLERIAATPDGWDEAQSKLAFDLYGVPIELRVGSLCETLAHRQYPEGAPPSQLQIAQDMIADLSERYDRVCEVDDRAQALAQADLVDLPTAELARLRRYEAALRKYLDRLIIQLQFAAPVAPPTPAAETNPTPPPGEPQPSETNPTSPQTESPIGETNLTPPTPRAESGLAEPDQATFNHPQPTETTPVCHPDEAEPDHHRRTD